MMMRIEGFPVVRPAWHNLVNLEKEFLATMTQIETKFDRK